MLTASDKESIIKAYQEFVPMISLAKEYGVTRQRVYQVLRRAGVDTSKGRVSVTCDMCGKEFDRPKCQVRKRLHNFCCVECYYGWLALNSADYKPWRQGMRIARREVFKHFALCPGHVVHHRDGNNANNNLSNLVVFANSGDHIRYHRGLDVTPLWDGLHNEH